ncbi:hypothetical protein K474DRAFT_1358637 [Panus rudis PR-1116 ss-1]|nr:hypothetical protein K474DRAFT_1358637 [Panus rudis PR-1116 ss-1]
MYSSRFRLQSRFSRFMFLFTFSAIRTRSVLTHVSFIPLSLSPRRINTSARLSKRPPLMLHCLNIVSLGCGRRESTHSC